MTIAAGKYAGKSEFSTRALSVRLEIKRFREFLLKNTILHRFV